MLLDLSTSTNQDVVNTLKSQSKRQYYDDLVDKRDSAKNRLTVLEELKKITSSRFLTDRAKYNLIKRITDCSPCCMCGGVPSLQLICNVG